MSHIQFFGAAQTVTGSKHLFITHQGYRILFDCGMFQGRDFPKGQNNLHFGFNPADIDAVLLSHAHIDHCGLLPLLVKQGFKGTIYSTPATADLCGLLLRDSAHIQQQDLKYLNKRRLQKDLPLIKPLYSIEDVYQTLEQFKTIDYYERFTVCDEVEAWFENAGHILGSALVYLSVNEANGRFNLCFSGDVGRKNTPIIRDPDPIMPCKYLILESTYGDRRHENVAGSTEQLHAIIEDACVRRKGKLIMPAFSVGRTQEILYALDLLFHQGRLPQIPIYLDSPLSQETTSLIKNYLSELNESIRDYIRKDENADPFSFPLLKYIKSKEESQALNDSHTPCIIISASGMAEAGRVKHHIKNNIENKRNTILFVGHCEEGTLGGQLLSGKTSVRIFGEYYQVNAQISKLESMSAHADFVELTDWLFSSEKLPEKIFLVHGEYQVQENFKRHLIEAGCRSIEIPEFKDMFTLH